MSFEDLPNGCKAETLRMPEAVTVRPFDVVTDMISLKRLDLLPFMQKTLDQKK